MHEDTTRIGHVPLFRIQLQNGDLDREAKVDRSILAEVVRFHQDLDERIPKIVPAELDATFISNSIEDLRYWEAKKRRKQHDFEAAIAAHQSIHKSWVDCRKEEIVEIIRARQILDTYQDVNQALLEVEAVEKEKDAVSVQLAFWEDKAAEERYKRKEAQWQYQALCRKRDEHLQQIHDLKEKVRACEERAQ